MMQILISIHALREEGDRQPCGQRGDNGVFLSTPSARRATLQVGYAGKLFAISIHALREEGDMSPCQRETSIIDFYPRPPRGGRPRLQRVDIWLQTISIHALREEGDRSVRWWLRCASRFLSTPSARRATADVLPTATGAVDFYPRPPRGGRRSDGWGNNGLLHFYPRPPRGGQRQ